MAKKETSKEVKETKKEVKEAKKIKQEKTVIEETTDENKKSKFGLILGISAVLVFALLIVVSIIQTGDRAKYYKEITFAEFKEIYNTDELSVVYWARPGCYYCQQFKPTVSSVTGKYKVTFNYLNTDNLDYEGYTYMYESVFIPYDGSYSTYNEENGNGVGTPAVLIVKNGKIVNMSVGAISE